MSQNIKNIEIMKNISIITYFNVTNITEAQFFNKLNFYFSTIFIVIHNGSI